MKAKTLIAVIAIASLAACAPKKEEPAETGPTKPTSSLWTANDGSTLDLSDYSFHTGTIGLEEGNCHFSLTLYGSETSGYFHTFNAQWIGPTGAGTDETCDEYNQTLRYSRTDTELHICELITDACVVYR